MPPKPEQNVLEKGPAYESIVELVLPSLGGLLLPAQLSSQCRLEIDLRRLYRLMSEPQCNNRTIDACLEKVQA